MRKNLDPNLRPEKQHTLPKQGRLERLCMDLGRARSNRKRPDPIDQAINQPCNLSQEIPGRTKIETRKTSHMHSTDPMHSINNADDRTANNNPLMPDVAFHPGPILRPPPKPIKQNMTNDQSSQNINNINPNINFDFEENSPFQEGVMSKMFQRLDKSFFQVSKELGDLINKGNFNHKHLPKQMDIDKILEIIQKKGIERDTPTNQIKRNTCKLSMQPIFQISMFIFVTKQTSTL